MSYKFDVFLSHNSQDKAQIITLAQTLAARGIKVWLDVWELAPGMPWQRALEEAISETAAAAVLVGSSGIGPWQDEEMRAFIMSFVERRCPVIPVLLPEAPARIALPLFLRQFSWVDLRHGFTEEGLSRLIWGITGKFPGAMTGTGPVGTEPTAKVLQLEEVFCTSGLPAYTYVEPAIYRQVASDLRQHGKHILLAGPSGSGKTCLVFRLLEELGLALGKDFVYFSALQKNADNLVKQRLQEAVDQPTKQVIVVDDFHLLKRNTRLDVGIGLKHLADLAFSQKGVAKFVLVGISSSPEGLLVNTPDLGPRLGVYRMPRASSVDLINLIRRGQQRLAVEFINQDRIVDESCGSYFVCQFLCKEICLENRVDKTSESLTTLDYQVETIRQNVMNQLSTRFKPMLSAFVMSNGSSEGQCLPTLALIAALSGIPKSLVTLEEIAAVVGDLGTVIRALEARIPALIHKCVPQGKFAKYLYYEEDSELFSVEDPVFRYFLNHLELSDLIESLGVSNEARDRIRQIHRHASNKYAAIPPTLSVERIRKEIFISYSHNDRKWLELIEIHLKPLARQNDLSIWSDFRLTAGSDWETEIEAAIGRAKVALILVSPSYLASDFLMSREFPTLLERASAAGLRIVWIPLEACAFEHTPLARYQAAISPGRPLASMSASRRNEALTKAVRQIAGALEQE